MAVELVNPDPRYGKVHLIEPAPLGYLHLAADVQAAHRPGPVLRRTRQKHQLLGVLKWQARRLAQAETVERATVYDALAFTPPGGYVKDRPVPLPAAWFDVVVLVETASPEAAAEVRAGPAYQVAARNVRRVGDVDKSRPGLFLFNYFAGDDPGLAVEVWDYLAGWYEAETGLDNSTLLAPVEGEKSDYVMINHARWEGSLPVFAARQLPKRRSAAICWPTWPPTILPRCRFCIASPEPIPRDLSSAAVRTPAPADRSPDCPARRRTQRPAARRLRRTRRRSPRPADHPVPSG